MVFPMSDLPTELLEALMKAAAEIDARSFAHFALANHTCAEAAQRVLGVAVPAEVARRLKVGRCAGTVACAKCPVMVLPASVIIRNESAWRCCDRTVINCTFSINSCAFSCFAIPDAIVSATLTSVGVKAFSTAAR